ncbi:MAG: hypothetical protein AAGE43_05400 [Pseudomonadota bacterium]
MPRWLKIALALILLPGIVVAIAAPIGPLPGFRLGGSEAAAPERWSTESLPDEVRLANYSGLLPHVVIIWVVEHNDSLFVVGDSASSWVQGTSASPDVDLRIGDAVYAMRADRLPTDHPVLVDVLQAYIDRYKADYPDIIASFPPMEEFSQGGAVFQLSSR